MTVLTGGSDVDAQKELVKFVLFEPSTSAKVPGTGELLHIGTGCGAHCDFLEPVWDGPQADAANVTVAVWGPSLTALWSLGATRLLRVAIDMV